MLKGASARPQAEFFGVVWRGGGGNANRAVSFTQYEHLIYLILRRNTNDNFSSNSTNSTSGVLPWDCTI